MEKVLIIADHKWRDLAGHVYLKYLLEKNHGIKVRLCNLGEDRFWVLNDKPDLVIYNNFNGDEKIRFAYWLKKQHVGVMVIPTEGLLFEKVGVSFEKIKEFAAGKFTDFTPVDLYLHWNEPIAQKIIEMGKLPPEKVKAIGAPRFDFYFPPLTKLFPGKEEIQKKYGLHVDPKAPIILYATNFTVASFKDNKSFLYKDWETNKLNRVEGYKTDQTEKLIESDTLSRSLTLESVKKLLIDFPDIQIIYKPHPSENHLFYKEISKEFTEQFPGRVAFVVQEYIWNLLYISDVLLQRTCTTAVEAWIFNKPTLQLHMHAGDTYFSSELAGGCDVVRSYEDIRERIAYYIGGGKIADQAIKNRNDFLEKWCNVLDGKRTSNAAAIIAQFLEQHGKAKYSFSTREFFSYYPKEYLKQTLRYGRDFYWRHISGVDKIGRIDKRFTGKDIKDWERQIASVVPE